MSPSQFIKRILILIIGISLNLASYSQQYWNEWIVKGQEYYKMQISADGIYRVSRAQMSAAGINVDDILLQSFQVFHNGEEIPIYVDYNNVGLIQYIEFYGIKNNGSLEQELYSEGASVTNPYYSLITDTSAYFLTWDPSSSNLRYSVSTDNNYDSYPESPYCEVEDVFSYHSYYNNADVNDARYDSGEGWVDGTFTGLGLSISKTLPVGNIVNAVTPRLSFGIVGNSNSSNNNQDHHIQVKINGYSIYDTVYGAYGPVFKTANINPEWLNSDADNSISLSSINNLYLTADKNTFSYIRLKYASSYDFGNVYKKAFKLKSSSSKSTVTITGFSGSQSIIYNFGKNIRTVATKSNGQFRAVLDNNGADADFFMINADSVKNVSSLKKIEFADYLSNGFNSDYIIISNKELWSSAQEYRDYRNSTGYNTLLVDVDELYNHFGYGINKYPGALRHFMDYLIANYDIPPKYLLLLGKGIHPSNFRKSLGNYYLCMVPSYGQSSDILITSGLNFSNHAPAVATGRIGAWNNNHVRNYLDKLSEHEGNSPAEWMKTVLHLGGGSTPSQQNQFKGYLIEYEDIIEDLYYGASVEMYTKTTSDVIDPTHTASIRQVIDNGCSLLTFFGHGAASIGFDIGLDDPDSYVNFGKYPAMVALSCLVGDIYQPGFSISEDWIFHERGAIAFLASSNLGYVGDLYNYGHELYNQISFDSYGKGIGICIKKTITELDSKKSMLNTFNELILHGDPAVVLNAQDRPDFKVTASDIFFDPPEISTEIDSFRVDVEITNIGKATNQAFHVKVERVFPSGDSYVNYFQLSHCYFKDTVSVYIPVDRINGIGINQLKVTADFQNVVDEESEQNNYAEVNFIIGYDDILPVWPYNYSIVPSSEITLVASTVNPFAEEQQSRFQIDTTDLFNSPLLTSYSITHEGGIVSWDVSFELQDSTVYFWRVGKVPVNAGDEINWKESSFIYIKDKTGWCQDHFFQFKHDDFSLINYNRNNRTFEFVNAQEELHCRNVGMASSGPEWLNIYYSVKGITQRGSCQPYHQVNVAVFDTLTLKPWISDRGSYGHHNYPSCGIYTDYFYAFLANSTGLASMANFLQNEVPDGMYVLIYPFISADFDSWDQSVFDAVKSLVPNVSLSIESVPDDNPYILFCKKGTDVFKEAYGFTKYDTIDLYFNINISYSFGNITSVLIGPSQDWTSFHWKSFAQDGGASDNILIDLSGVKTDGSQTVLLNDLGTDSYDILNLNDYVDPLQFPYLKLNCYTSDSSELTPAQLDRWLLTYDDAPETAIDPQAGYYFYSDTVDEGESVFFSVATVNISTSDMDSLRVSYVLIDKDNEAHSLGSVRHRTHPAGDTLILDTLSFSTLGFPGLNTLWIEVNPKDSTTGTYDQIEQYHYNNIASISFYVNPDRINPLLDVTVDGIHILDGDIVSAKPQILIKLKDENKFLALNDPELFEIYLTPPDGEEFRVQSTDSMGRQVLFWTPAVMPDNSCELLYTPDLITDGFYSIRVVAEDKSENLSGDNAYKSTFEVIGKSSITNIFNYPNPFSTSTRFVFELTGSEIPDDMSIQIMTITGKVVRVISMDELGLVRIGRNITEYAWDGKDMYGDQLANGVYFYRVITSLNGSEIERRSTSADGYFHKGFGKMYLMR